MSDAAQLLAHRLASAGQVSTIVGDRIRPDVLAEGERLPAITYETVTLDPDYHLLGEAGTATSRVQFDCYALTKAEAVRIAAAIADVLAGLAGVTLTDAANNSAYFFDVVRDNVFDRRDPPAAGTDAWRYRRVVDFVATHTIPTPSLDPL